MPTRRWPPADSAASITGSDVRPTPVAAKVAPGGSSGRQAASACVVPGMPPGTPMTRSTCTWPPCGGAVPGPAGGRAVPVEQPLQGGQLPEVEHLVLRDDPPLLHLGVQLDDEVPG